MIASISGKFKGSTPKGILIEVGGLTYEVYLTALTQRNFQNKNAGENVSLLTSYYIEGSSKSHQIPVLIGFENQNDKEFFQLFTTVEGIGVLKALSALTLTTSQIATAIEESNSKVLVGLKNIGERTAKKIIATLNGKVAKFALIQEEKVPVIIQEEEANLQQEALEILSQLGYNQTEARRMIKDALNKNKNVKGVEELIELIYKTRKKTLDLSEAT